MLHLVAVAALILAAPDAGAPSFRPFVAPPPVAAPEKLPEATHGTCRAPSAKEQAIEEQNERAALDAFLRAKGGMLLPAQVMDGPSPRYELRLGAVLRGPKGARWMVVSEVDGCERTPPTVGLDAKGEVFVIEPVPAPKEKRQVTFCEPLCGGCGIDRPPVPAVVEVPEGARLGEPRTVEFPLATQVKFKSRGRCQPVP